MELKKYINSRVIKHSANITGTVESIDENGLMSIKIKGRDNKIQIYNNTGEDLKGGESVTICRYEGSDQNLSVIAYGAFDSPSSNTVINI